MPEISIIIPVYNVEKYIEDCLKSVLTQTYKNFEAIIIDDGSPDNSIEIAKKITLNDDRFIFLKKENGGQASARNLGLQQAKGKYIAFIDSDDYISSSYLELMYNKITSTEADICTCDINVIKNRKFVRLLKNNIEEYYKKNDYLLCMKTISSYSCDKLYKASIFTNLKFDERIRTYEDLHFIFKVMYGKKIVSVGTPLYNYVQHPNSTTHTIAPSFFNDYKEVMNSYTAFVKSKDRLKTDSDYLSNCYLRNYLFMGMITLVNHSKNFPADSKRLMLDVDNNRFNIRGILNLAKIDKKTGVSLLILKISPKIFFYYTKLYLKIISWRH